jgi:hypothetical protein
VEFSVVLCMGVGDTVTRLTCLKAEDKVEILNSTVLNGQQGKVCNSPNFI